VNGLPVAVDPVAPKKNGCQDPTAIGVAPAALAAKPAITTTQASTSDFTRTLRMISLPVWTCHRRHCDDRINGTGNQGEVRTRASAAPSVSGTWPLLPAASRRPAAQGCRWSCPARAIFSARADDFPLLHSAASEPVRPFEPHGETSRRGVELPRWPASWRRSASGSGSARSLKPQ